MQPREVAQPPPWKTPVADQGLRRLGIARNGERTPKDSLTVQPSPPWQVTEASKTDDSSVRLKRGASGGIYWKPDKDNAMKKKEQQLEIPRFIKLQEVKRLTSLSTSEIYRRVGQGAFPKQIQIGPKSVVWVEREVYAWIDLMIAGREFDPAA